MKKKISCILAGLLLCGAFSGVGCSGNKEIKAPTFTDKNGGVTFGAYGAPTINRRLNDLPEDAYDKLAEAGFGKVWALYEGSSGEVGADVYETIKKRSKAAEAAAMKVLPYAEKAGIKYFVKDWSFYGMARDYAADLTTQEDYDKVAEAMFSKDNPYINSPAYGGNFCGDEPDVQTMANMVMQVKAYQKYIAQNGTQGGDPYINLLPAYIMDNSSNLSQNYDYTYRQYVQYYFDNLAPLLGYVCYDYYPLMINPQGEFYTRDNYYYNYELMANHCKAEDYELRIIIQTHGDWTGMRNLTSIADLRWQIYAGMAFGAKEFTYYTYGGAANDASATHKEGFSLYNYATGEYNWTYEAAKTVNNEIHAMENAYAAYKWDGVMYQHASEMIDNQLFMYLEHPLESHPRISSVKCTLDTLIGTFKVREGTENPDAFMFVNSNEPSEDKDNEVTVKFKDAKALLMYRLGQRIIVPLSKDGSYTFKLYPGEGRFVIPLK